MIEKRLIDANALIEEINQQRRASRTSFPRRSYVVGDVLSSIYNAPTVDAAEVVRCRECVSYEQQCSAYGYCYHWNYEEGESPNFVEPDDYCSYGERRNDG